MTLKDISEDYGRSAELIRKRMVQLHRMEQEARSARDKRTYRSRRLALLPMLRQCQRMAKETKEYYHGGDDHGNE